MPDHKDWDAIWHLNQRVTDQGQPLVLTDELRRLLRVTASDVAMPAAEAEKALSSDEGAAGLLSEIAKRIRVGSRRLSRAIVESARREEAGDKDGAREPFLEVLAVEVVPHYRRIAQSHLGALDEP
ncbi:DUSAM domain-containing protein [Corallococcus terminator]